jgi:hypothetical protein
MSYSDFSLSSVRKIFQLKLIEKADLFVDCSELQPSSLLSEILKENLSNFDQTIPVPRRP